MSELKELIKKSFDLFVKMRWLKTIEKENRKARKAYEKYKRHNYLAQKLFAEYIKLHPQTEIIKSEDTE